MIKIKIFILAALAVALAIIGLCSFSSEDKLSLVKEKDMLSVDNKQGGRIEIGKLDEHGVAKFAMDEKTFKREIFNIDILAEIDTIEMNREYLTIIGKDKNDFSLVSYQAKLVTEGNSIYFPNNKKYKRMTYFVFNQCSGFNCTSCFFEREKTGEILGCGCKEAENKENDIKGCNHTIAIEE